MNASIVSVYSTTPQGHVTTATTLAATSRDAQPARPMNLTPPQRFTDPHTNRHTSIYRHSCPTSVLSSSQIQGTTHPHLRCPCARSPGRERGLALPVKALKVGQEDYWLDQIAKDREEYFSGKGESPGRFIGEVASTSGLQGE